MSYDFDEVIDRRNTGAMAKDGFRNYLFGGQDPVVLPCADEDAISMWVADMAFASAPAARAAMVDRVERHPIFGYSAVFEPELYDSFARWCDAHYRWRPQAEHFTTSAGIVPALMDFAEIFVGDGDAVLTLTPAYGYFKHSSAKYDRELITCALVEDESGRYTVDMADFEAKITTSPVRMFFLCHPHNPTGRLWTNDELRQMADVCIANEVLIISDEIHCDLLRAGTTHTPLAKLYPDYDKIVTCMSSSKTFNLAGLGIANVIIANDELRERWLDHVSPLVNPLSEAAAIGVFSHGHAWHRDLINYLDANFAYLAEVLAEKLPKAVFSIPDATYLAWVNLAAYFPNDLNLTRYFAETCGVLLEGGDMFVADADGHVRLNLACPRSVLANGLDKIVDATNNFAGLRTDSVANPPKV